MSALKIAKKVYRLFKNKRKKILVDADKHPHLKKGRVRKPLNKNTKPNDDNFFDDGFQYENEPPIDLKDPKLNHDVKITKFEKSRGIGSGDSLPSSHYRKIADIKNRKQDAINKLKVKKKK